MGRSLLSLGASPPRTLAGKLAWGAILLLIAIAAYAAMKAYGG